MRTTITNVLAPSSQRRLFSAQHIALLILGMTVVTYESFGTHCIWIFRNVFVVRAGRTNPRHHKAEETEIEKTIRKAKID